MIAINSTPIDELLHAAYIRVNMHASSKEDILMGVTDLIKNHPAILDFDQVRKSVFEREDMMSTGVGNGLALPHAKTSAVDSLVVAFATMAEPVAFDSVDDLPVRLVFLIVSTEKEKTQHIKLLSRVSRCMNDFDVRKGLLAAASPDEVLSIFRLGESR